MIALFTLLLAITATPAPLQANATGRAIVQPSRNIVQVTRPVLQAGEDTVDVQPALGYRVLDWAVVLQ